MDLRVAEREGIGVDRMVREMVRLGHKPPDIREISGPYVRTSLVGDSLDEAWIHWLRSLDPISEAHDLNSLLLLRQLVLHGWCDATRLGPIIQLPLQEAEVVISKVMSAKLAGHDLLRPVKVVPDGHELAVSSARPSSVP